MENFEMIFDVKAYRFTHEPTGFTLNAEELFYNDNEAIIEQISTATGVEVDDLFIEVLRDTIVPF